jgi:branched-chain amino acid transport system substrate-binding protein
VLTRRRTLTVLLTTGASTVLVACDQTLGASTAATPTAGTTLQSAPTTAPANLTQQPATTPRTVTGSSAEIHIGTTLSLSGSTARSAEYQQQGYALWEELVNQRGGLLGRPVKLTILDDEGQPAAAVRLYEKLIVEERVDLVLGPHTSSVTTAASTVTEKHGYPLLTPGLVASDVWKRNHRFVFGVQPVPEMWLQGTLEVAAASGLQTVAILNENSPFPNATATAAAAHARSLGMELVLQERYAARATDLTPALQRVKAVSPHTLLGASNESEAVLIARQARELGVTPPLLGFTTGGSSTDFGEAAGTFANHVIAASIWEPELDTPSNKAFVEAFRAKWGREPNQHAATGYSAAQTLEEAVSRANTLERRKLRDTLAELDSPTILPGTFKVDATGVQIGHTSLVVQWRGGQKVVVWPKEFAAGNVVLQ